MILCQSSIVNFVFIEAMTSSTQVSLISSWVLFMFLSPFLLLPSFHFLERYKLLGMILLVEHSLPLSIWCFQVPILLWLSLAFLIWFFILLMVFLHLDKELLVFPHDHVVARGHCCVYYSRWHASFFLRWHLPYRL